jgi:hypothetical protein
MLRACIQVVNTAPECSQQLRTSSTKIRVSLDSTHEQIAEQIRNTFGLGADSIYELTNDSMVCSLQAVVASMCRWVQGGDVDAPLEYDGDIDKHTAIVTLQMTVIVVSNTSNTSEQTAPTTTFVSPASTNSCKKMREHKPWKQDAMQVGQWYEYPTKK